MKNPTISSSEITGQLTKRVSERTIRRRLSSEFKLPCRVAAKKPLLNDEQRKKRIAFCKKYKHWTAREWGQVLFSDETMFMPFGSWVRLIRRSVGKRYDPRYTLPTVKHCKKQMIWGCFSSFGPGALYFVPQGTTVNAAKYLDILDSKVSTTMQIHRCKVFQQDGAPCHTAKVVTSWFAKKKIKILEWPGNLPDLNPIENLWMILKRRVKLHAPHTMQDLNFWIMRVWCFEITKELCQNLINSMPKRIKLVLKNKGHSTKY